MEGFGGETRGKETTWKTQVLILYNNNNNKNNILLYVFNIKMDLQEAIRGAWTGI